MHTTYLAILTQLNNAGARYRQFRHEPLISAWELDETLPFALDNLLKTVAFRIKDEGLVLAGVQGFARIDYRALADVFGINRRQLRALGPEEVVAELAMEVGGVCPLPQSEGVAVVIDVAMAGLPTVICGSGLNTVTLEVETAALLTLSGAIVAPIARE